MSKSVDITGFEPIGGTSKLDLEVKKTRRQEGKQNSDNSLTSCPPALCGLSKVAVVAALLGAMTFGAPAMAEHVYTVVDGTSVDYSYTTTDGVTPLYKSIIINTTDMKTSSKIGWEKSGSSVVPTSWDGTKATGTIKVTMPHNGATQDEYYTYTYTKLDTYTPTSTRINNNITADNTDKKVFVNINTFPSGGAIYNNADKSLINILSDFIMNTSTGSSGGAIYNGGKIGTITGDFIGNTSTDSGGAIFNGYNCTIGTITGDFIGNTATNYHGGAIFNTGGTITSITGDFIGNTANQDGGAIYNGYNSTIDSITGDFIGNTATDSGGAIYNYNYGKIGTITGDFIGNTATNYHGGAIFNGYNATIDSITGDFIGNTGSYVGAIYNDDGGTIGTITGDFIGNTGSYVGAIINVGTITTITGDFIGNTANQDGGAIYNQGTISNIEGDFILNTATTNGGAINNQGTAAKITNITGNFSHNSANGGGAIYNFNGGEISNIAGNFEDNSATTNGGAICNFSGSSKIGNIAGNFKRNHADGSSSSNGGAIYNGGTIGNSDGTGGITGDFENNSATNMGGAIVNGNTINKVTGNFTKNSAKNGGAVYNAKIINFVAENGKNITFSGNYVTDESGKGGAIFNATTGTVGLYASADHSITFTGDTTDLPITAKNVDSIHNINILNINGDGTDTYTGTVNLYNVTDAATAKGTTNIYGGTVNANANIEQDIINVKSGATLASNTAGVEIKADGTNGNLINDGTINITGANSRFGADHLTNNATINITGANSLLETSTLTNNGTIDTVALQAETLLENNRTITTSGKIEALIQNNTGGSITFNGDAKKQMILANSGTVNFNGGLSETGSIIHLTQNAGKMNFSTNAIASTATRPIDTFTMNGGLVNIADGSVNTLHIKKLNLTGNTNFAMDADLAAESMDKIEVINATITEGKVININKINLLSDATQEKINLSIFADDATRDALKNNVHSNINGLQYSPIYKYDALYNPETGMVGFTRYKNGGYDDLNPSIMAGAVAAQVGGYLNQLTSYDNAFEHMDSYMNLTRSQRTAMKMLNRYASADVNLGTYNPNQLADESRGIWFKPYASFEKVNLKGGPNVENTAYGSFVGGDSDLIELKNGWDVMYSAYASYDGSHQNYDGVSVYQNGGHLGGTATWYKGNFFTGLTANVGASNAEASTMYGQDNFTMLSTGIASKTGYNWELKEGKFIIQPSWLMSYSFVNTFDYTNAAGVRIDSDGLHAIQLVPGLKFIGNLKNGWQPYIGVQMVWNIMDDTKFKANNVDLPQMSVKPYIQYGVGVQKRWGERFTAFFQTMIRNGGRNGVALTLGFRWAIGKESSNDSVGINKTPELPQTKITLNNKKGN